MRDAVGMAFELDVVADMYLHGLEARKLMGLERQGLVSYLTLIRPSNLRPLCLFKLQKNGLQSGAEILATLVPKIYFRNTINCQLIVDLCSAFELIKRGERWEDDRSLRPEK